MKHVKALVEKWYKLADDFDVTCGDSQVEDAYNSCATELEAAIAKDEAAEPKKYPYPCWLYPLSDRK